MGKKKIYRIGIGVGLVIIFISLAVQFFYNQKQSTTFNEYYKGNYSDIYKKLLPAAENGDAVAQVSLGNLYARGLGVKQSYEKAFYWYKKASNLNNSDGYVSLGLMYNLGQYVKQDFTRAVDLYRKAIEIDNNATAKYNLSFAYLTGNGIRQNYSEGISLLKQAAEQDNSSAMLKLGNAYNKGKYGVDINYENAFALYKQSADLGDPIGQNNLAVMYYWGEGTGRNPIEAYKWFYIAANYGNYEKAKTSLEKLKFDITESEKKEVEKNAQNWINNHKELNQNIIDANYKS